MTARNILFAMICMFCAAALLLLYNSYYRPVSMSGLGLPAVTDRS
ncbi:hypothetical protein QO002_002377 [Pararhizobium capsulatum DSM 1112]|uniref:Uncharacterized protein n=1 Tax=Pararhizobium capsulatum DSM 1112 TaxID=1121113 RepID=A0ABU0BPR6_9HYPH|nr:hypothetical protein [Pararhizobium capsulatum]MDQ0320239.1 hypothetical protein [Pararhizobium capsulatum DSM 1112]